MLCFPGVDNTHVRPKMEVLRQRGVPLVELHDPEAYEGSDLELVKAFAAELGVALEIWPVTTTYDDLIHGVATGRGDLAASSLSVTEARLQVVDFSSPVGDATWAVVAVRPDSDLDSLDDLVGKRGAAMRGSSQQQIFEHLAPEGVQLVPTSYSLQGYDGVLAGDYDFVLMDSENEVGQPVRERFAELVVGVRLKEVPYGIAVPKGSDLLARLDEYLASRPEPW